MLSRARRAIAASRFFIPRLAISSSTALQPYCFRRPRRSPRAHPFCPIGGKVAVAWKSMRTGATVPSRSARPPKRRAHFHASRSPLIFRHRRRNAAFETEHGTAPQRVHATRVFVPDRQIAGGEHNQPPWRGADTRAASYYAVSPFTNPNQMN
jgi:hypothetical protein